MTSDNLVPSNSKHACSANCIDDKCDENNELLTKMMSELDEFTKLTAACLMICKNVEDTVSELKKEIQEIKDTQQWMMKYH